MPSILNLKPEDVDTAEKRGKYTVSIIGCGKSGILYAVAFAEAGYKVICADADQSVVKQLARGKTPFFNRDIETKLKGYTRTGQLNTTSEIKKSIAQSDIIIIAITAKIDDKKTPDYSEVENSCKQVGTALRRETLVIYSGTASFGFTEGALKEILQNTSGFKAGEDFGLAYTPIHMTDAQTAESISNRELTVAAGDITSLDAAATVLRTVVNKEVHLVLDVKTAELAALFAVAWRDANAALANELAILCERAGVDYFETCKLLASSASKACAPTVAADEEMNEVYLLLESAENFNTKLRVTAFARQVNESMVKHAVDLVQETLRGCGKALRRAKVAVVGNVGRRVVAEEFVKLLEIKGAKVSIYDPFFAKNELVEIARVFKRSFNEAVEGADCLVISTAHEMFKNFNLKKLRTVMKMPAAIVDLTGTVELPKVEKEGFTYRGLGRGVGKK